MNHIALARRALTGFPGIGIGDSAIAALYPADRGTAGQDATCVDAAALSAARRA